MKNKYKNFFTIFFLVLGYYGCYHIGYSKGEKETRDQFQSEVEEVIKSLNEAQDLIKEVNNIIKLLEEYNCIPKDKVIKSLPI